MLIYVFNFSLRKLKHILVKVTRKLLLSLTCTWGANKVCILPGFLSQGRKQNIKRVSNPEKTVRQILVLRKYQNIAFWKPRKKLWASIFEHYHYNRSTLHWFWYFFIPLNRFVLILFYKITLIETLHMQILFANCQESFSVTWKRQGIICDLFDEAYDVASHLAKSLIFV